MASPHNGAGRGCPLWGPRAPRGSAAVEPFALTPVVGVVPPDGPEVPHGRRQLTPIERIATNRVTLTLEDGDLNDNALMRIDGGGVDVLGTEILPGGAFAGFQRFSEADPGATGRGVYRAELDVSRLEEGLHYLEAVAFLRREPWQPPILETFRKVIRVER